MSDKKQTILFVDDELNVLSSIKRLLYDEPWNIHFASSGVKGLEVLKNEDVDLIISDVRMPGMDGISFLKQVKELYPHIVRIFLSGYAEQKAVIQAFSEGAAQQLLPKPWKDNELLDVIRGALIQAGEMKKKNIDLQKIINSLASLPPMPHTYIEFKKALFDTENVSIDEVVGIIEKDTSISAELLRWANSAMFGQRSEVDSVKRAALVLGLDIVEGLVLSKSIFNKEQFGVLPYRGLDLDHFQIHSYACGIIAKLLMGKFPSVEKKNIDRAFTAGMLHDIGKLVEQKHLFEQFKSVVDLAHDKKLSMIEAEKEALGTTHAEIGGYLADWWNLPSFLVNVIRWHHEPSLCNVDKDIIACVHIADLLVMRFEIGASGNCGIPPIDRVLWDRFKITEDFIDSIKPEVLRLIP